MSEKHDMQEATTNTAAVDGAGKTRSSGENASPGPEGRSLKDYFSPRVWRIAFLWFVMRGVALLPFSWQMRFGRWLGRMIHRYGKRPRHVAERNIAACFPDLDAAGQDRLLCRHFESLGAGVAESCFSWWASDRRLLKRRELIGLEHLREARAAGKGVLLLSAHFTTLEICGIMLSFEVEGLHAVFRPYRKNRLADDIVIRGRSRGVEKFLDRNDVKSILRSLAENKVLWYASDQLVRPGKRSELLPFFGVPALVHSGIVDLARLSGCKVVPFLPMRLADGTYRLKLLPALDPFPSGDRRQDLLSILEIFENHIAQDPAQYLWVRPRFSRRPPPHPDLYAR